MFLRALIYVTTAFTGYLIGRLSHCYFNLIIKNQKGIPHHWIYGLVLIIIGSIFYKDFLGLSAFSFGAGLFVSDFGDFLKLRFIAAESYGEDKKNFWGIN